MENQNNLNEKKKITRRVRSTSYSWTFQEESALIVAVEKRPPLWNAAVPEYKMPNIKADLWGEVVAELGIEGMTSVEEGRNKWNNLRSNFKAFIQKQRAKKSGQGAIDPTAAAKYPHHAELLFIVSADVENSSESTSTLHVDNAITDESFLDDLSQAAATYHENSPSPLLRVERRKRAASKTSQSLSPTPSRSSSKESAVELLQSLQQRAQSICHNDHFASFGDFIAGRLRNLKPDQAVKMEKSITLAMYSCLESFEESSSQTANSSSQTALTSTAQLADDTNPIVKPSASTSQGIRPRSFRTVGLPQPPPLRVVENLKMRSDNAPSKVVPVYTETLFPDYNVGDSDSEGLIELSP